MNTTIPQTAPSPRARALTLLSKIRIHPRTIPLLATVLVFFLLYAVGIISFPHFGSLRVFVDLFKDNAFLGVVALGSTFVILSGGIDLSVGSVVAFTSIFIAQLVHGGTDPGVAIALALVLGTLFGCAMGSLIHFYQLPPFLVTLGGLFFARGMAFVIHPQSLALRHALFGHETARRLSIPLPGGLYFPFFTAVVFLLLVAAAIYLAQWTRFGRAVYALGGDESSAQLMGLPVGRTKVLVYTLAGFFSAAGGVVYTFYMQAGNPASTVGLELQAIASVVIGGTLITGGSGFVFGTMLGVLILGLIQNLITFQGKLNTWWTPIVVGVLLMLFILMQKAVVNIAGLGLGSAARRETA